MKNSKALLKHKLMNIITMMMIWYEDEDTSKSDYPIESLKQASLLIAYENLFISKSLDLFIQPINLRSLFEMIIETNVYLKNKNIDIANIGKDVIIDIDKYCFADAIKLLLSSIYNCKNKICISFNRDRKPLDSFVGYSSSQAAGQFIITHGGQLNKSILNYQLASVVDNNDLDFNEFNKIFAVAILKQCTKSVNIDEKVVSFQV